MTIIRLPQMVSIPIAYWRIIEWGVSSYTKCARCFRSYGGYSKSIYPYHQSKLLMVKSLIWLKNGLEEMIQKHMLASHVVYSSVFGEHSAKLLLVSAQQSLSYTSDGAYPYLLKGGVEL